MKVVYFSVTGQTKRFAAKLNAYETIEIDPTAELEMKEPYVLVVPTYEAEFIAPFLIFLKPVRIRNFWPAFRDRAIETLPSCLFFPQRRLPKSTAFR